MDFEEIVGNNYKVCFRNPSKDNSEEIIYGKIQNADPSGKVVIYVERLGVTQGLYIIPYSCIKWMMPNGLSEQFKDKIGCNFDKKVCVVDMCRGWRLDEIQYKFDEYVTNGISILDATIKICEHYDLYFYEPLYNVVMQKHLGNTKKEIGKTFMKEYIKCLNLNQYRNKHFDDSKIN